MTGKDESPDYEPIKTGKDGFPVSHERMAERLAIKLGLEYGSDLAILLRENREELKRRYSALEDSSSGIRLPEEPGKREKALTGLKTRP